MPLLLNPRVWMLAERLYVHAHEHKGFQELLASLDIEYNDFDYERGFAPYQGKYVFMSEENFTFARFMQLVPSYKYLPLLKRIVFDQDVRSTQNDNWNYYGEAIRKWYPELLDLLKFAGVEVDQTGNQIVYVEPEEPIPVTDSLDFVGQPFCDVFLDYIRRELNEAYSQRLYLATMFLARKALEVIIVRVMEVVFPKLVNKEYSDVNHELWYDKSKGRHQGLGVLIENIKDKSNSFHEDKDLVLEFVMLAKPFKNETNLCVHLDYRVPDEAYIKQWKIPYVLSLAARLFKKYCNP